MMKGARPKGCRSAPPKLGVGAPSGVDGNGVHVGQAIIGNGGAGPQEKGATLNIGTLRS